MTFTAPTGKNIVWIKMTLKGDSYNSSISSGYCYVYGQPKSNDATEEYSKYQFKLTHNSMEYISTPGGFRWEAPIPFDLTIAIANNALPSTYTYNIASQDITAGMATWVHNPRGYLDMAIWSVENTTGTPNSEDIIFKIDIDTSTDVIKEISFPYDTINGEDQIKRVDYRYVGEDITYTYIVGEGTSPLITETRNIYAESYNGTSKVLKAADEKSFAYVEIHYDTWTENNTKRYLILLGYLKEHNVTGTAASHKLSVTYEDKVTNSTTGRTFNPITGSHADIEILDTVLIDVNEYIGIDANILAANRSNTLEYQIYGDNSVYTDTSYLGITFHVILPTGLTLTDAIAKDYDLIHDSTGNLAARIFDSLGNVIIEEKSILSSAEANAYFGVENLKGATQYEVRLEDEYARMFQMYNYVARFTLVLDIVADIEAADVVVPYSKVLYMGTSIDTCVAFAKQSRTFAFYVGDGEVIANNINLGNGSTVTIGNTANLLSGSSDKYLMVSTIPYVSVDNAQITKASGGSYLYKEGDDATIAVLAPEEKATLSYTVTNTITDLQVTDKIAYVYIPLPQASKSSLMTEQDFTITVDDVRIIQDFIADSDGSLTMRYNELPAISTSAITLEAVESDFTSGTLTMNTNSNTIILKLDGLEEGDSFLLEIDITAPSDMITDAAQTYTIDSAAISIFKYNNSATGVKLFFNGRSPSAYMDVGNEYVANNPLHFRYSYNEWDINYESLLYYEENGAWYSKEFNSEADYSKNNTTIINGSSLYSSTSTNSNKLPSIIELDGYTFEGWYLDNGFSTSFIPLDDGSATEKTSINGHTTLYAKYMPKKYSITYDTNGYDFVNAIIPDKENITWLMSSLKPDNSTPQVLGKTFIGWGTYADASHSKNIIIQDSTTFSEIFNSIGGAAESTPVVLYAHFEDIKYTVVYDFSFHHTYTGAPAKEELIVTFDDDHLFVLSDPVQATDTHLKYSDTTFKDQYEFVEWRDEQGQIISSTTQYRDLVSDDDSIKEVTIYAIYKVADYATRFFIHQSSLGERDYAYLTEYVGFYEIAKQAHDVSPLFPLENSEKFSEIIGTYNPVTGVPSIRGYTFNGWYVGDDLDEDRDSVDITTYPHLTDKIEAQTKWYEAQGYSDDVLSGFLNTGDGRLPREVLSLYADFTPNDYEVNYNFNGYDVINESEISSQTGNTWTSINLLSAKDPVVLGKTFIGWSTHENPKHVDYRLVDGEDIFYEIFNLTANETDKSITLHAQFVDDIYTLNYDFSSVGLYTGAPEQVTVSVTFDENQLFDSNTHYQYTDDAFKSLYIFMGWVDVNGNAVTDATRYRDIVSDNADTTEVTIYAKYQIIDYTIKYFIHEDNFGGLVEEYDYLTDNIKMQSRAKEEYDTKPVFPTTGGVTIASTIGSYQASDGNLDIKGYEFLGWYAGNNLDESNDGNPNSATEITDNITYYEAHGYTAESALAKIYQEAQLPETVLSLYAKFKPYEYTVNYDNNNYVFSNIDSMTDITWASTDSLIPSTIPAILGKEFIGWSTKPNSTDAGYRLIKDTDNFSQLFEDIGNDGNKSITLYAQFEDIIYTVTYDFGFKNTYTGAPTTVIKEFLYEDVILEEDSYQVLTAASITNTFKEEYTFMLWENEVGNTIDLAESVGTYTYHDLVGGDDQVREITLYAKHAIVHYAIRYFIHEDSKVAGTKDYDYLTEEVGFYERAKLDYDEAPIFPIANSQKFNTTVGTYNAITGEPSIQGYEFIGWYVGDDSDESTDTGKKGTYNGTVQIIDNTVPYYVAHGYSQAEAELAMTTGDLELPEYVLSLFAKYEPLKYTVKYDFNGFLDDVDSIPDAENVTWKTYNLDYAMTDAKYHVTGQEFVGWYNRSDYVGEAITSDTTFSEIASNSIKEGESTTLYAKYAPVEYTVTYDLGYEEKTIKETLYWTDKVNITPPSRDGYTFAGWWTVAMLDDGTPNTDIGEMIGLNTTYEECVSSDAESGITLYAQWTLKLEIILESEVQLNASIEDGTLAGILMPKSVYKITNNSVVDLEMVKVEVEYLTEDWGFMQIPLKGTSIEEIQYQTSGTIPDKYLYITLNGDVIDESFISFSNIIIIGSKQAEIIDIYAEYLLKETCTQRSTSNIFTINYHFKVVS